MVAYLHGEAVGVGMLFAAFASRHWGMLPKEDFEQMRAFLEPLIVPVELPPLDEDVFTHLILRDKKAANQPVLRIS